MLWVDKYAPKTLADLAGQGKAVREVTALVESFQPGKGIFIVGPIGSGKTSIVEALAKEKNYQLMRLDASEKRSGPEVEEFARSTQTHTLFHKGKFILIDELDKRIIALIQGDLPLDSRPFAVMADQLGITEDEFMERVKSLKEEGVIRRFGATLYHQ